MQNFVLDRTKIFRAYQVIDEAGPRGLSATEFGQKFGLRKLDTRGQIKTLERRKLVHTYMKDVGRQKTAYYVAKRFAVKDPVPNRPEREKHEKNKKVGNSRKEVMTERQIERRKKIIEFVNNHSIIPDPHKIYR